MTNPVVNPAEPVDYSSTVTPSCYVCGSCGKSGVRLWHDPLTYLERETLYCATCAADAFNTDISTMHDGGEYICKLGYYTDRIGWMVRAVPTKENDKFWEYPNIPEDGCTWWESLPI